MTGAMGFTNDERNLLVRLPRWIVGAASAPHVDTAAKTRKEIETGFLSVANGRKLGNPVVVELAGAALQVFDEDPLRSGIDPSTEAGRQAILEHARGAVNLLRAKAEPADAVTYRRWLLTITDDVITAVRSDERLGFGGVQVHPAEQAFRQQLAAMTRATAAPA